MKLPSRRLPLLLASVGTAFAFVQTPAIAQAPEDLPVKQRPRPEYDPVGIRQGNVFFYPSIAVTERYNDNVFATENGRTSDFITVLSPTLTVQSDGTRGRWRAGLAANIGLYASETEENYEDLTASIGGDYDVVPDGRISVDGGLARLHEDRDSPDDAGGTDPTVYYRATGRTAYSQRFNRLAARVELQARDFTYEDVDRAGGGSIDNSDRDRTEFEEALRLSYEISPGYSVFTRGALSQRRYDDGTDSSGFDRDSDGYRIDAGVSIELTDLITVEAGAGYLSRDYEDSRLSSVNGVSTSLSAVWAVTRLTTVTATIDRDVEETTVSGASGRLDTTGRIEVDHELRRNVILSGELGYRKSQFEGISRTDDRFNAGVSVDYLVTQGAKVSAAATHVERNSDAAGADFAQNIVSVRLSYGF